MPPALSPIFRCLFVIHSPRLAVLVLLILIAQSTAWAQGTFNIEDYFILASNSEWHYTGRGMPGSSANDDFSWTVLDAKKDVGGGLLATRIKTTTDQSGSARNQDEDFWRVDPANGDLVCYGFHNGIADTYIPVQDIVLTDPLLVGRRGLRIGDVVTDTGAGKALASVPIFGQVTVNLTASSTAQYKEFVPVLYTPYGRFDNVLHVLISIDGVARYKPFIGNEFQYPFSLRALEFYLKKGVGLVMQDQNADPAIAKIQALDRARVNGMTVVTDDPRSAGRDWPLYE